MQETSLESTPAVVVPDVVSTDFVNMGSFQFTRKGMSVLKEDIGLQEWGEVGRTLAVLTAGIQLCVGDWLNYGESQYGEQAAQYIDASDWCEDTIRVYRWVAGQVPMQNRIDGLTVGHYMSAATLPEAEQKAFLQRAHDEGWTVRQLKAHVSGSDVKADPQYSIVLRFETEQGRDDVATELRSKGYEIETR